MKYKKLSILAAGAAIATTALVPLANVNAEWSVNPTGDAEVYITRKVEGVSGLVNNTFTYTITADTNNPAEVGSLPATAEIVFTDVQSEDGVAYKTGTIDFSGVSFSKVGDYRFLITETASSDAPNYPVSTDNSYYIGFYVRNIVEGGVITDHEAHLGHITDATYGDKKTMTNVDTTNQVLFTAGTNRTYITIDKTVTGTGADDSQCFEFSVSFSGHSDLNYALDTSSDCDNPDTVNGGSQTTIRLKHGETATIGELGSSYQIPIGASYSFYENGATDYETYIDGSTTDSKSHDTKEAVSVLDTTNFPTANQTHFVNKKDSDAPTGIVLSILPFVLIALAGIGGAFYVAKTKKVAE